MSVNRKKSGLIHIKNKEVFKLSKEIKTGKFFIRGTDIEVPENKICRPNQDLKKSKPSYDFSKPSQAQDLGDEWEHYAWSSDDY